MNTKELLEHVPTSLPSLSDRDVPLLMFIGIVAVLVIALGIRMRRRWHWLDGTVLKWNDVDRLTLRHLSQHLIWMGATGSGKTSSAERLLARILQNALCGMLLMGAKPEDLARASAIAKRAGRVLKVFGPGRPLKMNIMDYLARHGGDARNMTKCRMVAAEGLSAGEKGGDWRFWEENNARILLHCIMVLLLAYGRADLPDIQRFITDYATSRADLATDGWKNGFQYRTLRLAFENAKTARQKADFAQCEQYWLGEFPSMPDKTRGSILTGVQTILSTFNSGELRELFSTTSNFSLDDVFDGAVIYVDASPTTYGQVGVICSATMKYLMQWRILQRPPGKRLSVIWCDEFQQYVNSFDADFLAQARSHMGAMVCLTQGTEALIAKLGDEHKANALLTGFNHRVFNSLGCFRDAEWAADLIGRKRQLFHGGSIAPPATMLEQFIGSDTRYTGSFNEQMEYVVPPIAFMTGLRQGGEINKRMVDAIVCRTGLPFASNGENFIRVHFKQGK